MFILKNRFRRTCIAVALFALLPGSWSVFGLFEISIAYAFIGLWTFSFGITEAASAGLMSAILQCLWRTYEHPTEYTMVAAMLIFLSIGLMTNDMTYEPHPKHVRHVVTGLALIAIGLLMMLDGHMEHIRHHRTLWECWRYDISPLLTLAASGIVSIPLIPLFVDKMRETFVTEQELYEGY